MTAGSLALPDGTPRTNTPDASYDNDSRRHGGPGSAPDVPLGRHGGTGHPRAAGASPRVLLAQGAVVRRRRVLELGGGHARRRGAVPRRVLEPGSAVPAAGLAGRPRRVPHHELAARHRRGVRARDRRGDLLDGVADDRPSGRARRRGARGHQRWTRLGHRLARVRRPRTGGCLARRGALGPSAQPAHHVGRGPHRPGGRGDAVDQGDRRAGPGAGGARAARTVRRGSPLAPLGGHVAGTRRARSAQRRRGVPGGEHPARA